MYFSSTVRFEKRPIKFFWGDDFDKCVMNLRSLLKDEQLEGNMCKYVDNCSVQLFQEQYKIFSAILYVMCNMLFSTYKKLYQQYW